MSTPRPPSRQSALVAAVLMQKGGTGKTTSTINLTRAMSQLGRKVLVIDFDPQGNATDALSIGNLPRKQLSVADGIVPHSPTPLADIVVPTIWDNVWLAPANNPEMLSEAASMISAMRTGGEYRLREALEPELHKYDHVLIDNAPSLGLLLVNALVAAHRAVIAMEADRWSAAGLALLRQTIDDVRRYANSDLDYAGVLINRWRDTDDERTKLTDIREHFPDAPVWSEPWQLVPLRVGIKNAINAGQGLDQNKDASLRVIADTYTWVVRNALTWEAA